jgi:hypothetical protein
LSVPLPWWHTAWVGEAIAVTIAALDADAEHLH